MKTSIPINYATRLINHGPTILVTSQHHTQPNIITLAWNTPVSHNPPMIGISVAPSRYSHDLILNSKEFVVNIPHHGLIEQVYFCGTNSGREVDKFAVCKFTPLSAKVVKVPLIEECIGHLECEVVNHITAGDHTVIIGKVLNTCVTTGTFDKYWILQDQSTKTIHHLGGSRFVVPGVPFSVPR